ncbi:unnamed protein product [Bursaphelenchus xylophilus]|uniref:(pine wood nematode) hypothetical protein n=1 Tax=Bursaphelenchus xylophilus TaxID=6326 RepID=A0A1I7RVP4_BURXY|nr:unnamed protein product [Bursaphelenchus xylophilus]CAG9081965.1 unnamed protein product [Bursaphelenchus xylophilus]
MAKSASLVVILLICLVVPTMSQIWTSFNIRPFSIGKKPNGKWGIIPGQPMDPMMNGGMGSYGMGGGMYGMGGYGGGYMDPYSGGGMPMGYKK